MSKKSSASPTTVTLHKTLEFPPEVVFDAWCEAEQILEWFCPSEDVFLSTADMDVQPGGRFHFVYTRRSDGGVELEVTGKYQVVDAPKQLVFSWIWSAHMPAAGTETLVSIELAENNGGTELTLTHSQIPDKHMEGALRQGWTQSLDSLAKFTKGLRS